MFLFGQRVCKPDIPAEIGWTVTLHSGCMLTFNHMYPCQLKCHSMYMYTFALFFNLLKSTGVMGMKHVTLSQGCISPD